MNYFNFIQHYERYEVITTIDHYYHYTFLIVIGVQFSR